MSEFLGDEDGMLGHAIKEIVAGKRVRCAVAFWGSGAEDMLLHENANSWKTICNLDAGGTNPNVIDTLRKKNGAGVRHNSRLHAKVYLNDKCAVVASANASANGLGLEGSEVAHWVEAGVRLISAEQVGAVSRWFDKLWDDSRAVTATDLKRAKLTWAQRQQFKPMLSSFADFNLDQKVLPQVSWSVETENAYNKAAIKKQGFSLESVLPQLDRGVEIEGPEDAAILTEGTWVLWWWQHKREQVTARSSLRWSCLGRRFEKCYRLKSAKTGPWRDIVAEAEVQPPAPFDITEQRFRDAFRAVMNRDEFYELRKWDYEGAWFHSRQALTRKFWHALKDHYQTLG